MKGNIQNKDFTKIIETTFWVIYRRTILTEFPFREEKLYFITTNSNKFSKWNEITEIGFSIFSILLYFFLLSTSKEVLGKFKKVEIVVKIRKNIGREWCSGHILHIE